MLVQLPVALVYGVGGVGKSALVYALAAGFEGPVVYDIVKPGAPLAALVDDVRRQLARGAVPQVMDDDERLLDLAQQLDGRGALWVLDDLHRLDEPSRLRLLDVLGRELRNGRLVATSRELVPMLGGTADRFELRLGGLDEPSTRMLWAHLDTLYGPSSGFEVAWARSRGNPFHLRRAHAGGVHEEDPTAAAIRALPPDQRFIAALLALAAFELTVTLVERLLPEPRARAALRELVIRLIIEVDGSGRCVLHDIHRDAVLESLSVKELREHHARLAALLADAELDPVVRVRERCRHLCASGHFEEAGQQLLASGAQLIRLGVAGELFRGFEALPPEHRTPEIAHARARTFARLLDLRRAYEELLRIDLSQAREPLDIKTSLANVAMLAGDMATAEQQAREVLDDARASPSLRMRAETVFALTRTYRGFGDEARVFLDAAEREAVLPLHLGFVRFTRAFTLWIDQRNAEAVEAMRSARAVTSDTPPTFRGSVLGPIFYAGILSSAGRFERAEELLRQTGSFLRHEQDPRLRVTWRSMHAMLLHERGERAAALDELHVLEDDFQRAGELLGELWTRAWIGCVLMVLGRCAEAGRILAETDTVAREHGIAGVCAAVERARREDPLVRLREERVEVSHPEKRGEVARARSLATLLAVAAGDTVAARIALEAARAAATGPDYGLDRAILALAESLSARLEGDPKVEQEARERAEAEASAAGVDADLLVRLTEALGATRLVTAGGRAMLAEPPPDDEHVIVDARRHELRYPGHVVSLKQRPVLRKLLYALASHPGDVLPKEQLVERTWGRPYNPLTHDNQLWVNVCRLREFISGAGMGVERDESGYHLRVPEQFVYVEPRRGE
ncbi:winged helix-turn-helix domain-containing protein [Archangium sp.]|uniref:winged helix-turn-helix domain-containing protein n=1 Tax=Archangium sp. TaxID=1872627 RepID=UPI00286C5504|nr:winged helix-turn-helix domain-containing protein [Archangium sp.]